MQRFLQTIVLFLFTLYVAGGLAQWGAYYLNADAIAEAYCQNRETPACHGKCHMAQLATKKQTDQLRHIELSLEKIQPFDLLQFNSPLSGSSISAYGVPAQNCLSEGIRLQIFHPPIA